MFPLASIIRAANPQQAEELQILANIIKDANPQHSNGVLMSLPSTSKLTSPVSALADQQVSNCTGARRKMVAKRKKCKLDQKHKDKSGRRDHVHQIENASPVDCISHPDLVLSLDETERFDSNDDDIQLIEQVKSELNSTGHHYVFSPTYRFQATSDVSTEPVPPLLSPNSSSGHHLSPEVSKFRANPLSSARWSDSDSS